MMKEIAERLLAEPLDAETVASNGLRDLFRLVSRTRAFQRWLDEYRPEPETVVTDVSIATYKHVSAPNFRPLLAALGFGATGIFVGGVAGGKRLAGVPVSRLARYCVGQLIYGIPA